MTYAIRWPAEHDAEVEHVTTQHGRGSVWCVSARWMDDDDTDPDDATAIYEPHVPMARVWRRWCAVPADVKRPQVWSDQEATARELLESWPLVSVQFDLFT